MDMCPIAVAVSPHAAVLLSFLARTLSEDIVVAVPGMDLPRPDHQFLQFVHALSTPGCLKERHCLNIRD